MPVKPLLVAVFAACLMPRGHAVGLFGLAVPLTHVGYDVVADVTVGTPRPGEEPQTMQVLFDTGSYNTTKTTHLPKTIGTGPNAIVLESQQFALASEILPATHDVMFSKYAAVIGMDLVSGELAPQGAPEPFLTSVGKKYEKVPVVGFYINRLYDFKSKIMFNGNDVNLYTGKAHTHNVVTENNLYSGWKLNLGKLAVGKRGGNEVMKEVTFPEGTVAKIISRINALLVGPVDAIEPLNEAIFRDFPFELERTTYSFACQDSEELSSALHSLPQLTVQIDTVEYTFLPVNYIRRLPGDVCRSILIATDVPGVILGQGFMTKYYTRLDFENKQVQFARVKL